MPTLIYILNWQQAGTLSILQDTGFWIQDTGYRIPDTGYRVLDTGYRIPDKGYRIPDTGYRVLNLEFLNPKSLQPDVDILFYKLIIWSNINQRSLKYLLSTVSSCKDIRFREYQSLWQRISFFINIVERTAEFVFFVYFWICVVLCFLHSILVLLNIMHNKAIDI